MPHYFRMPREIRIGNQPWSISCVEVDADQDGSVVLLWLLSGPYDRHRAVRMRLHPGTLIAHGYDAGRAAELMRQWLPSSDRDEVLEISGEELLRAD